MFYHNPRDLLSLWSGAARRDLTLWAGSIVMTGTPAGGENGGRGERQRRAAHPARPTGGSGGEQHARACGHLSKTSAAQRKLVRRAGRRCGTRTSASGRPGPGRRCATRSWRWRRACISWGSSAATPSPSSARTGRRLYWSVAAAQALGAIPVPVYADAVADELAFVLAHAEVRFAAVEDQEQVDKILSVSERLPKLEKMVYDERRGLRDYDHANLHPVDEVIAGGRKALKESGAVEAGSTPRSRRAKAPTPRSSSTPPAPPGSRRAWCSRPSAASLRAPTPLPSTS